MTPRRSSRHPVSPSDARAYLSKSEAWLEAAVESLGARRWDVEALSLLETAGDDGRYSSRQLSQLLRFKSPAQYDPAPIPEAHARKAVELARRLVVRATMVIERRHT